MDTLRNGGGKKKIRGFNPSQLYKLKIVLSRTQPSKHTFKIPTSNKAHGN